MRAKYWMGVACLLCFELGESSPASSDEMVAELRALASKAAEARLGFCNETSFGAARCEEFSHEVLGEADFREIDPVAVEPDDRGPTFRRLLGGCDLSGSEHPFAYTSNRGEPFIPVGPFTFYDGRLAAGGTASDAIVRAEGFFPDGDREGVPYPWVSYFFVQAGGGCRPAMYAFMGYGGLFTRAVTILHQDGLVIWQGRPFLMTLWELASLPDALYDVALYRIDRPPLRERSQAASVHIFMSPQH